MQKNRKSVTGEGKLPRGAKFFSVVPGFGIDEGRFTVLLFSARNNVTIGALDGNFATVKDGRDAAIRAGLQARIR